MESLNVIKKDKFCNQNTPT